MSWRRSPRRGTKDCWRQADVLNSERRGTIGQIFSFAKRVTTIATDKPGAALAEQLLKQSEADAAGTPMDAVLDAARAGRFTDDQCFRLLARLWTLKRTMYYVYGGWAQGINLNGYPPTVAYLFGKQTHDDSTQEMQLWDEILRRRWVRTQKRLFARPYAQFGTATRTGSYIFCLRALANYPQNIRIAALNLGPKVIELAWTEKFAKSFPDETMHAIFQSQLAETHSHMLMGRFQGGIIR